MRIGIAARACVRICIKRAHLSAVKSALLELQYEDPTEFSAGDLCSCSYLFQHQPLCCTVSYFIIECSIKIIIASYSRYKMNAVDLPHNQDPASKDPASKIFFCSCMHAA